MELIIHYGMHKTGSSSIQDTLFQLDNDDFTYIEFGRPNPSLQIIHGFSKSWHERPVYARKQLTQQDIDNKRLRARERLIEKISSVKTNKSILSAEAISSLEHDEIMDFFRLIRPFASKIRAIGYVRSPKSYTESVFQQRVKRSPVQLEKTLVDISYQRLIRALDEALGESNVEVYNYDRSTLKSGCVVKDFTYRCGIDVQENDIVSSNESLSRPSFQMLYMLWKYYPEFYNPQLSGIKSIYNKLFGIKPHSEIDQKIIINAVEKISQFPGMKLKLHSDAYRKIVSIDVGELEWLKKRTGISFEEDIHAHDETGIRDEADIMQFELDTIQLLLEKLQMSTDKAFGLMQSRKLLAKHILMLAYKR